MTGISDKEIRAIHKKIINKKVPLAVYISGVTSLRLETLRQPTFERKMAEQAEAEESGREIRTDAIVGVFSAIDSVTEKPLSLSFFRECVDATLSDYAPTKSKKDTLEKHNIIADTLDRFRRLNKPFTVKNVHENLPRTELASSISTDAINHRLREMVEREELMMIGYRPEFHRRKVYTFPDSPEAKAYLPDEGASIIRFLAEQGERSLQEVAKGLSINYSRAKSIMKQLRLTNQVTQIKDGRKIRYFVNQEKAA